MFTLCHFSFAPLYIYLPNYQTLQKLYFYTHPLFTYHPPFFHYLFSNFADEWAYTPKRTKKRERRWCKQTTARNKQTIINIHTYETVHFIMCPVGCSHRSISGTADYQTIASHLDQTKPVEQRIDDAISRMTLAEKIRIIHAQSKFSSAGVPRLGFPDFWTDDGPHGVRPDVLWDEGEQAGQTNDSCVAFPALTCLAASWNPQMSRIYGEALGEEALHRGRTWFWVLASTSTARLLNGRNFEYMGEDPFRQASWVVPYIRGLQSKGHQPA